MTVTGTINGQPIVLDNAATEATLQAILAAMQGQTAQGQRQTQALNNLAQGAGVNQGAVQNANRGMNALGTTSAVLGGAFAGLTNASNSLRAGFEQTYDYIAKFTSNAAQPSDLFTPLLKLGGPVGLVASAFHKVLLVQEEWFSTYQKVARAGASFGGSLTDMRLAASGMYMTLGQFGDFVTKNTQPLTKLGGTVEDGARQFAQLSKSLISGQAGTRLMELGYSTDQINQGMADYINVSGQRNAREAKDTQALAAAAAGYMENLNALATLTGKSVEEQQAALDEASKNAAFQSYLNTLSEKEREKALAGMQNALALGGKGAVDAFQSKLMGIAPDKAGAMFIATASETAKVVDESTAMVRDASKDVKQMTSETMVKGMRSAQADMSKYSREGLFAIIRQGGPVADALQQLGVTANKASIMTEEDIKTTVEAAEKKSGEAKAAAASQLAVRNLGQEILNGLMPVIKKLLEVANQVVGALKIMLDWLREHPTVMSALKYAILGAVAAFAAFKVAQGAVAGYRVAQGVAGAIAGGPRGIAGALTGAGGAGGAPAVPNVPPGVGGAANSVGGIGSSIERTLKGLARGLRALGKPDVLRGAATLVVLAGSLVVAAYGLKMFTDVDWESFAKGGVALGGLVLAARGLQAIGNPQALLGAVTLGILSGSLFLAGIGLQKFAEVSWTSIGKGFTVLAGLGVLAAVLGLFAPVVIPGALALALLGAALIPFGAAAIIAGKGIDSVSVGLTKMTNLDGGKLARNAVGLAAISGSLLTMIPFSLAGPLIAASLFGISMSLEKMSAVDPAKLEKVAAAMKKVKDNSPGIGQAIGGAISTFASSLVGGNKKEEEKGSAAAFKATTSATAAAVEGTKPKAAGRAGAEFNLAAEIKQLNTISTEMLRTMKDATENIKRNVDATKSLNHNLFPS